MIDVYVDLVFCNDSVLRVKNYHDGKEIYYPLTELQTFYREDETFLLRFFNQNVFFEKETTLANIILALEPWQNIIAKYTDRDVNAYCAACKTPVDATQTFSYLEISKLMTFFQHYEYPPMADDEDLMAYLNNRDHRIETGLFNMETETMMCGYHQGDNTHYSTSSLAFDLIKHTPVIVVTRQKNVFLDKRLRCLSEQIRGFSSDKNQITSCYSLAEITFCEALSAIFIDGLFYHQPVTKERSDAFHQMLTEAAASYDDEAETQPALQVVDDSQPLPDESEPTLRIGVAPGAFDSVIEHETEKEQLWEEIYASLVNKASLKIGNLVLSQHEKSFGEHEKTDTE